MPKCDHGNITLSKGDGTTPSAVGTTATYKCDSGYTINGGASLTCQASGKWSAAPPTCVVGELQPVHLHITSQMSSMHACVQLPGRSVTILKALSKVAGSYKSGDYYRICDGSRVGRVFFLPEMWTKIRHEFQLYDVTDTLRRRLDYNVGLSGLCFDSF